MKILITGTAGFIGFHLAKRLLIDGHEVVGLDNINDYYDVNLKYARLNELGISKSNIEYNKEVVSTVFKKHKFVKINLEDKVNLFAVLANSTFDIIVNLAAQAGVRYSLENPDAYIQSNIVGFLNVLEGCRQFDVKKLVYASSSSVYGLNSKIPFSTEDRTDKPVSLYAATKKSNELMAHTYSHLYGIETVGLRFFTVYGPWGRPDMAPILFAKAIAEGNPIKVFNNGNLERDFTYIDDIINGIMLVVNNNVAKSLSVDSIRNVETGQCRIYNIGNNSPVNLMDFIGTLEDAIGKKAIKRFLPMQPGDVYKTWADCNGLAEDYYYNPSINIKSGIKKFVIWFRNYY